MIENTVSSVVYTADGTQTVWSIPFPYGHVEDVKLFVKVGTSDIAPVAYNLFSIDTDLGTITYPLSGDPLASNDKVIIMRITSQTQEETSALLSFKSQDIERMADKLTMEVQELQEQLSRCIAYNPVDAAEGEVDAQKYIDDLTALKEAATSAATTATTEAGIATTQASIATTKASEAATSAENAASSATSAASSATNAAASATAASNSAAAAYTSEQHTIQNEELLQTYVNQASASATAAETSATAAAASATSASSSATAAGASETSAGSSAGTATTKAAEAAAYAQAAAESAATFTVDSELSSTSTHPVQNRVIYNQLNNIRLVQIVDELPATGDGKSVYGVIQDEMTRDGYPIVQLFCWDVDDELWYAVAAYSIDINPVGIVYVDSVPYSTSTRVGGLRHTFDSATGTLTLKFSQD